MKNRQQLAKYFATLEYKIGAEIGVCKGYYSKTLCDNISGLKLYGIDPWSGVSQLHKERDVNDFSYKETLKNLNFYIHSGQYIIIRETSMDALDYIPDGHLDFVFIDANHGYEHVKQDIEGWAKKVRSGGIVSGHDYYISRLGSVSVIRAVDEYVAQNNNIDLKTTEWDKDNPDKDSRQPCWYFIKP